MAQSPIYMSFQTLINAATMTASITPSAVDIAEVSCYCVQAVWTGTPAGNIVVEGSNDNSTFTQIATQAAGGAASSYLLNVDKPAYRWVRVKYTFTSSTGTLTATLSCKGA